MFPADPLIAFDPVTFGKYTLVAHLARGGMGEIYLALLEGAGGFRKQMVVKRLLASLVHDVSSVSMLLDEARLAAQLSHPNVCHVYELGEVDEQYFIAMEYLHGLPLSRLLRKPPEPQPLDPRFVAGVMTQAAEGLHHAHELTDDDGSVLGLVHRDISPQNLFVTSDGVIKVLDFGIAKLYGQPHTYTGTLRGKYAYMSPEQVRGLVLDRRSDVFALGIIAFEMLTALRLFRRGSEIATLRAISEEAIPTVRSVSPDMPEAISQVVARALERDREARWPTTRAFSEALSGALGPLGSPMNAPAIASSLAKLRGGELASRRDLVQRAMNSYAQRRGARPTTRPRTTPVPYLPTLQVSPARGSGSTPPPSLSTAAASAKSDVPATSLVAA